jgi:hypothetical protein
MLSMLVRRGSNGPQIVSYDATGCSDCREPLRFVVDLLSDCQERRRPRLLPGLDLLVDTGREANSARSGESALYDEQEEQEETEAIEDARAWKRALQARNVSAGYLAWLLDGARAQGLELDGVRVALRDRVETWPVVYRQQRWMLDYDRLPPDSPLRLAPSDVKAWLDEENLRQRSIELWRPLARPLEDGGMLRAEDVVGVAFDPILERWLLVIERLNRRLSAVFAMDSDGTVLTRTRLPPWPEGVNQPIQRWRESWTLSLSPDARRLLVSAAGRWWIAALESLETPREFVSGQGMLRHAAWSPDGERLAWTDARDQLSLVDARTGALIKEGPSPGGGEGGPVVGLAFTSGGSSLLTLGQRGRLLRLSVPWLVDMGLDEDTCEASPSNLTLVPRLDTAFVGCSSRSRDVVLTRVDFLSGMPAEDFAVASLQGELLSVSPNADLVVLATREGPRKAVICDIESFEPIVAFSELPLLQVAWNNDGSEILALRADGVAVWWSVEGLLRRAEAQTVEPIRAEPLRAENPTPSPAESADEQGAVRVGPP